MNLFDLGFSLIVDGVQCTHKHVRIHTQLTADSTCSLQPYQEASTQSPIS